LVVRRHAEQDEQGADEGFVEDKDQRQDGGDAGEVAFGRAEECPDEECNDGD
jgi:hypothetical protein